MNPQNFQKFEEIFQAALDLSGAERERFLDEKCAGDAELRRQIVGFIAGYEAEENFLESPVWTDSRFLQSEVKKEIASSLEKTVVDDIEPSPLNRRIGVYRLVKELGKGGMGEVFLAERADGEFRQNVAVKLIKRGMDTDFIVKRFRHERQIAAALNHPNIARLFDGGTTDDDLPYFIMEYVAGEPILKYCDEKNLDLRRKLELFLEVCAAIAYAHKRKIIHRDIKPSNILVNEDGTPKLLDFGIAKLLDAELIHESVMPQTGTQMRLMTPEYASPEQVRGDEIDEASDQYSLGVLLYELITGTRPYKFPSRSPHEIARVICEEIPSEPSGGSFEKTPGKDFSFDKDFCEKLDRIVLKSLEKNPLERYASVKDFAEDIERFLRGEQVRAEAFAKENSAKTPRDSRDFPVSNSQQKSIAVLPFRILNSVAGAENESGDFLGIGLADALIIRLSNIRQFVVRPTSSILRYVAGENDSFAAGADLNVQYVLDGNIIKTGSRLRVSVQLLNVADQSTIWAERFDEDFSDVLTLEDSISKRVAELLVPHLSAVDAEKLAKRATDNAEAYELFLRGRAAGNFFTEEGLLRSIEFCEKAVRLDPSFSLAYAAIADAYLWLRLLDLMPFDDRAKNAARRAVEIDPNSSEGYATLGLIELYDRYDWRECEKNIRHALAMNPNNSIAHNWMTHLLYTSGRFAEAETHILRAIELDPTSLQNRNTLTWGFYFQRNFEKAIAKADELAIIFPATSYPNLARATFYRLQGNGEKSLECARRALEFSNDTLFSFYGIGAALAAAGHRAEALKVVENPPPKSSSGYHASIIYCALRDKEKAFALLDKAFAEKDSTLIWVGVEPSFDFLRDDERYAALLKKMNHPLADAEDLKLLENKDKITSFKPVQPITSEAETLILTAEPSSSPRKIPASLKYALAAIAVIIGGLFFYYAVSQGNAGGNWRDVFASSMNVKRVSVSGKTKSAAVSPDGKSIAYIAEENNRQSIWLKSIDANDARQLAIADGTDFNSVVFAPDGAAIYYMSSNSDGSFNELFRVSLKGDAAAQKVGEVGDSATFAPDGKRIAFFGYDPKARTRTVDVADFDDSGNLKPPVHLAPRGFPNFYYGTPAFSPDGKEVAAVFGTAVNQNPTSEIAVIDLADHGELLLNSKKFSNISSLAWRGDNSEIVVTANETAQSPQQLWLVAYPSGEATPLTRDLTNYDGVSLSKDGATLLTVKRETSSNIALVDLNEKSDSSVKQLTNGSERQDGIKGLQWTSDDKILYVAGRGAETVLTLADETGANSRTINAGDLHPINPMLTSDRRYLFFNVETKENAGLWRVDSSGENLKRITSGDAVTPSLSPDDAFIIYSLVDANNKITLHRVPAEGGEETQLTVDFSARAVVSPDKKLIACYYSGAETKGHWQLVILNSSGGVPVRVIELPAEINLQTLNEASLAWSVDNRSLYYLSYRNGVSNIFRVSIENNRQNEQLTHFSSGKIFAFAIAPGEKRAAVARGATSSEIVVFKNSR